MHSNLSFTKLKPHKKALISCNIEGVNKLLNDGLYIALSHDPSFQELKKSNLLLNILPSSQIPPNPNCLLHFPVVLDFMPCLKFINLTSLFVLKSLILVLLLIV